MPSNESLDAAENWIKLSLILAFMGTWIYFVSFSIYSAGCHKFSRPADERLRICENHLRFLGFVLKDEGNSRNLRLQGIALSELGRTEEARQAFDNSILILAPNLKRPRYLLLKPSQKLAFPILDRPLWEMNDPRIPLAARELWKQVLNSRMEL